jgi:hypothetical protein
VIDVRDDAKIARQLDCHEKRHYAGARWTGQLIGTAFCSTRHCRSRFRLISVLRCRSDILALRI